MRNISDIIEAYLKDVINSSQQNVIEVKRSELADRFQCVPSQINYVIKTRFTLEKGYIVESKRGGGGYIRIIRVKPQEKAKLLDDMIQLAKPKVSQQASFHIVDRLIEEQLVNKQEAKLMLSALSREVLTLPLPLRDELRSKILTAMLACLKYRQ
ncbi:CtsR family transcriptional regulator [Salirhabdus salicampi]|uniref:CtsR family transcriptional regulator n=1 Tax=Salirhabdus salicampi TaxID=476102 RepID=UPI0020C1F561|nr:CtsR family transcriptional regulator [Salirhabdus salicampi]MCP8618077.1 CtsR family transcriptional regulator [Salirhabdus salicampi]